MVKCIHPALNLTVCALLWLAITNAHGQAATERYIPIGQSPGISQSYSYIGKIRGVDEKARTLTIQDSGKRHSVEITPQTHIWLDRSKRRGENSRGDFKDCRKGRRVEIKYADADKKRAEWIKVAAR